MNFQLREIKQVDIENLMQSWKQAYTKLHPFFYPYRFQWLFYDNPFKSHTISLPIKVAEEGGRFVSWVCDIDTVFFIKDENVSGYFAINTFTLEDYRGKGLGISINKYNSQENKIIWSVSMSDSNRRNHARAGWINGKPLYLLCTRTGKFNQNSLWKSLENYFKRHQKDKYLLYLKPFNFFLKFLLLSFAHQVIKRKKNICVTSIVLKEIDFWDQYWDKLWNDIKKQYDFGCNRSSLYLNWKYTKQPHVNFKKYYIYKQGVLIGTVVCRGYEKVEEAHGLIVELLLSSEERSEYSNIINLICEKLKALECKYIYIATSSLEEVKLNQKNSFRLMRVDVPMLHIPYNQKNIIEQANLFEKGSKWLISLGDQDMDQLTFERHPSIGHLFMVFTGKIPGSNYL